jgi:hypothetical protein
MEIDKEKLIQSLLLCPMQAHDYNEACLVQFITSTALCHLQPNRVQ